jgi:hypothetical protein
MLVQFKSASSDEFTEPIHAVPNGFVPRNLQPVFDFMFGECKPDAIEIEYPGGSKVRYIREPDESE